ncbi:hypothetical protein ACH5RR_015600 [Cinchona calisaya]|uniref:RNase H type-1 domain-containing protein n=1 Tax=Cinchona calisaya TaxID=153742 RepID=A0ABD2ZTJ9_9GENT
MDDQNKTLLDHQTHNSRTLVSPSIQVLKYFSVEVGARLGNPVHEEDILREQDFPVKVGFLSGGRFQHMCARFSHVRVAFLSGYTTFVSLSIRPLPHVAVLEYNFTRSWTNFLEISTHIGDDNSVELHEPRYQGDSYPENQQSLHEAQAKLADSEERVKPTPIGKHTDALFPARGCMQVNHLSFVDDLLIFTRGDRRTFKAMLHFLETYEADSRVGPSRSYCVHSNPDLKQPPPVDSQVTEKEKEEILVYPLKSAPKVVSQITILQSSIIGAQVSLTIPTIAQMAEVGFLLHEPLQHMDEQPAVDFDNIFDQSINIVESLIGCQTFDLVVHDGHGTANFSECFHYKILKLWRTSIELFLLAVLWRSLSLGPISIGRGLDMDIVFGKDWTAYCEKAAQHTFNFDSIAGQLQVRELLGKDRIGQSHLSFQHLAWVKPLANGVKLNVDASSIGNPGLMGCGGALQDSDGYLIYGFSKHLGPRTNLEAEAFGLLHGLEQCGVVNIQPIIIHVDYKILVDMINGTVHTPWRSDWLVPIAASQASQPLAQGNPTCSFATVLQEGQSKDYHLINNSMEGHEQKSKKGIETLKGKAIQMEERVGVKKWIQIQKPQQPLENLEARVHDIPEPSRIKDETKKFIQNASTPNIEDLNNHQ